MNALLCTQCGAGLPAKSAVCAYCGTFYERSRASRPSKPAKQRSDLAALGCPRCYQGLRRRRLGAADVDLCHRCGGLWVDHVAMSMLMRHRDWSTRAARRVDHRQRLRQRSRAVRKRLRRYAAEHPGPIACPQCHRAMQLESIGGQRKRYVDVCERHGTWFDARELSDLLRLGARRRRKRVEPHGMWTAGPLMVLIAVIAEVLEEIFDFFD